MLSGDKFCRSVLYPRCAKHGVFDEAALLQFSDVYRDGTLFALSLASRFSLRTEEGAHEYGRRTAKIANEGIKQRTGNDPSAEERVHYLGFYDLVYGPLSEIKLEHYQSRLRWVPEHGETAHHQLEWALTSELPPGNKTDKTLRKERSAARTMIAALLHGPYEDHNNGSDELVSDFDLPSLPRLASA